MGIKAGEDTFYQAQRGIVQDGLVLNLDAGVDESYSGGTVWRDLKGGNDGTLNNMNSNNLIKDRGGVLSLDGTDEYVEIPVVLGAASTSFTVSLWCKVNALNGGNSPIFLSNYGPSARNDYWSIAKSSSASSFVVRNDTRTASAGTNIYHDFTGFKNFTIVRDHSNNKIDYYVNNSSNSSSFSGSHTIGSSPDGDIYIGRHLGRYLDGEVASINVYNRALTSDEVARNYNATRHRFGV
jgi:hypothetical protein